MFPIHGFFFYKDYVIYRSVVGGDAFCSMHKRAGLTDQQARGKFIIDHNVQVESMLKEKKIKQQQSKLFLYGKG